VVVKNYCVTVEILVTGVGKKIVGDMGQRELRIVNLYSERSKTERGSEGPGLALLAGAPTH
jgi:hypothetical protein